MSHTLLPNIDFDAIKNASQNQPRHRGDPLQLRRAIDGLCVTWRKRHGDVIMRLLISSFLLPFCDHWFCVCTAENTCQPPSTRKECLTCSLKNIFFGNLSFKCKFLRILLSQIWILLLLIQLHLKVLVYKTKTCVYFKTNCLIVY